MRGTRAKLLRKMAYTHKVGKVWVTLNWRERTHEYVDPPNRHRSLNKTCIADELRFLYQALKGRRSLPPV